MAVWSEIFLDDLDKTIRFDPEYYQPKYLQMAKELKNSNAVRIDSFADVTDGIHGSPEWVEENGVRYLSAKSVKDNYFVLDNGGQISKEQDAANPRTRARLNDVLITTVGTIGNSAVVNEDVLPANMDRHLGIIRIRPERVDIDPYYLSTFLNSFFGRSQSLRESTGNIQLNLFIDKINALLVPLGDFSKQIASETREAYGKLKQLKDIYTETEMLLTKELGLDKIDFSYELSYERNFDEVTLAGRLDAQHYQPKYYRVLDAIKAIKPLQIVNLESLLEEITNGQTPLHHDLSVGDVRFLTAEHIYDFRINYDSDKRVETEHHEKQLKKTQVKENDVLITIKGRIGNVAVVEDVPFPTNINQDVGLLRLKDNIHPYYIAGFLNSQAGKALTEQICTGQINPFLGLGNLRTVKIPIFETKRMNDLGEMIKAKVKEATETEKSAKQLLEDAKRRVENMILGA